MSTGATRARVRPVFEVTDSPNTLGLGTDILGRGGVGTPLPLRLPSVIPLH